MNGQRKSFYSTSSWENFQQSSKGSKSREPYNGLITATHEYMEGVPIQLVDLHCMAVMDLINTHVYPVLVGYGKLTISPVRELDDEQTRHKYEEYTFTIGTGIPLTEHSGNT
jgi:hypothetical protein